MIIYVIENGKIITNDTIDNFKSLSNETTYILELNHLDNLEEIILKYKYEIISKNKVRIYISKEEITNLMKNLINNKYQIYSVQEEKLTSEQAFIKKVGENKID